MDRRVILFAVLSAVILIVWTQLTPERRKPVVPLPGSPVAGSTPGGSRDAAAGAGTSWRPSPEARGTEPAVRKPARRGTPTEIELGNDELSLRVSTAGGRLVSAKLNSYRGSAGGAVELLHVWDGFGSFEVGLSDAQTEAEANESVYSVVRKKGGEIGVACGLSNGLTIRKTYRVPEHGFLWEMAVELVAPRGGYSEPDFRIRLGTQLAASEKDQGDSIQVVSYSTKRFGTDPPGPGLLGCVSGQPPRDDVGTHGGPIRWAGFKTKYFAVVVMPAFSVPLLGYRQIVAPSTLGAEARLFPQRTLVELSGKAHLGPGETASFPLRVFAGPVDVDVLQRGGGDLDKVIDLGLFTAIGRAMLAVLKILHRAIPSWGVAIIVLTLLVRGVLWYPSHRSMVAMRGMQKIQPHLQALQQKYKGDPKRLQQEMARIYREHGISPLLPVMGCLPMLMQMPIFIALYSTLSSAIELRGAGFLWLSDLSSKDPFYVMPVAIGVSMWVQQKMSMSPTMDPAQQKMMLWLMPGMMLFIFLNIASGLGLYFVASNLVSLGQQYYVNKVAPLPPAAAPAKK